MPTTREQQLTHDAQRTIHNLAREIRGQVRDLRVTLTAIENAGSLTDVDERVARVRAVAESDRVRNDRDRRRITALLDDLTSQAYPTAFADVSARIDLLWEQVAACWPAWIALDQAEIDRVIIASASVGATLDELIQIISDAVL